MNRTSRLAAEFVGTAFLLATVVGSGIMAENLTDDVGLQLLQNAFATAGVLTALILALGPASGAHFNPAVTIADRIFGGIDTPTAMGYILAQLSGAIVGVVTANAMFGLSLVDWSTKDRGAGHLAFADGVATLGLLLVIFGVVRSGKAHPAAFSVGGYIAGAYYFTSSTSFANPAVTIAACSPTPLPHRPRIRARVRRRPADRHGTGRRGHPSRLPRLEASPTRSSFPTPTRLITSRDRRSLRGRRARPAVACAIR